MGAIKSLLLVFTALVFLLCPNQLNAMFQLPDNLGIDYKTMTVKVPAKLQQAGMRDVRADDPVTVEPGDKGGVKITNRRTGMTIEISPSPSVTPKTDRPR